MRRKRRRRRRKRCRTMRRSWRWERGASAAAQWRQRSRENPQEADLALADAKLHLHDAAGAARVMAPYAARAAADPQLNAALVNACARSFAAAGKDEAARQLLEPLLARDPAWRKVWIEIASSEIAGADAAQAWLKQVMPLVSAESAQEQFDLAGAWYKLASRFHLNAALHQSGQILDRLLARADAKAAMFALRGRLYE